MELSLTRPIVFFDLETTGTNISTDRIVEIALLKIHPDGNEESLCLRINPEMKIPAQSSAIHGITEEMVKDSPTFKDVGHIVAKFISKCDLAGYNSNRFDIPLIAEEFIRVEIDIELAEMNHVDVQTIFHKMEQRTLSAAYKFYCNKELLGAHSADVDTRATYEVLKGQLDLYPSLENNIEWLSSFSTQNKNADFAGRIIFDKNKQEVFNFGKYKGKTIVEVFQKDLGYYNWLMNGEFPLYTKKIFTKVKQSLI